MHDSLQTLRTFVRVAELKSFTQAAASLGIARTQVSTMVQQLEREFGCRLLHRTTRSVSLTIDGQACYQRALTLLADYDDLSESFAQRQQSLTGRLRIDMPLGFARLALLPALQPLLDEHPELQLEISSTDRKVDVVAEGFDAVLRVGSLQQEGVVARHLGDMQQINLVAPSYIERYGEPTQLDQLADHQLVAYVAAFGQACGFDYVSAGEVHEVAMPSRVTVNNSDAYTAACLQGLGLIQTAKLGVQQFIDSGELVAVLAQYPPPPMPMYLIYPHRRHLSSRLRQLSDWLIKLLDGSPGFSAR
ncbi:LysR family transcriptional regulator [Idiomarina xiamenensis]|uniref:LysR family transcriptional regulator n=1 Tax=Idiomarina xiamenensis 10-D-4 TaxID=740709 RepID=K2KAY0_9GAMM|nr:LysR family transcriptional regulator [Idiomarina xiamenensis]EKE83687.1 LysR family transcriptional regulator [Idiomarina xiamenensis 10-D-4]